MASKVNIRFVVILASVVVAVFAGVAATLYVVLQTSPEENAAEGRQLLSEGEGILEEVYAVLREPLSARDLSGVDPAPFTSRLMDESLEPRTINVLRVLDESERRGLLDGAPAGVETRMERAQEVFGDARQAISRAVNEEQGNVEYLLQWRRTLEQIIPQDEAGIDKAFREYASSLRSVARARETDVETHERYLNFLAFRHAGGGRAGWERFTQQVVDDTISFFAPDGVFAGISGENPLEQLQPEPWHRLLRFSGLGYTRVLQRSEEWDQQVADRAELHLLAALRAAPESGQTLRALFELREARIRHTLDELEDAEAARELASGIRDRINAFLERHPDEPAALVTRVQSHLSGVVRRALEEPRESVDTGALLDDLGRAAELLARAEIDPRTGREAERIMLLERGLRGAAELPHTRGLMEALVERRPLDPRLLVSQAELRRRVGDRQGAMEVLDRVRGLPRLPVSVAGRSASRYKLEALKLQSRLAFDSWSESEGSNAELAERSKQTLQSLHEEMSRRMPSGAPELGLSEARMHLANGDLPEAKRVLMPLAESWSSSDTAPFELLLRIETRNQNWTAARRYMEQALQRDPGNVNLQWDLSTALQRSGQLERAKQVVDELARRFPDNEQIQERQRSLAVALGEASAGDPVRDAIAAAQRLARGTGLEGGDVTGAIGVIEQAQADVGPDPRLSEMLVRLHLRLGDRESARAVIESASGRFPEAEVFGQLRSYLEAEDPVAGVIERISANPDLSDLDKAIRRAMVYLQTDQPDKANEAIAAATELDGEDPRVIELRFRKAIRERDRAEAERLATLASERDIDGVEGARFRAEVALNWDERERAVSILREAVEQYPGQAEMLRQLGALEAQMGELDEALTHLERAFELRGSDAGVLRAYTGLLARDGQIERALEILRDYETQVARAPRLRELRRDLESAAGDREAALAAREMAYERNPGNRENAIKLARLYVETAAWDEARELIDALRAEEDSLDLVTLDARWHAAQGNIDRAKSVFTRHISERTSAGEIDARPYLAFAQMLDSFGRSEEALETLRIARRWQSEEALPVEKRIGRQLVQMGRYEDAIESFETILDAGADDEAGTYRKQLAAAQADAGRHEAALQTLEPLSGEQEEDPSLLALKAGIARSAGRTSEAREHLDRAIRLFPDSPQIYTQRAQLSMQQADELGNEQLYRDALADLDTALEAQPGDARSLVLRGRAHEALGDVDTALRDFRRAAESEADDRQLVTTVLRRFVMWGRDSEAASLAQDLADQRENDPQLLLACSSVFAEDGQWARARRFAGMAWERVRNAGTARAYTNALLNEDETNARTVLQILAALEPGTVEQDANLLLARAEALVERDRADRAVADAQAAGRLIADSPGSLLSWYNRLERVFDDRATLVRVIDGLEGAEGVGQWLTLLRANAQSYDGGSISEVRGSYQRLMEQEENPDLARAAYRALSNRLLERDEHEEAARVLRAGADRFQTDWQLANNLAFVLVDELGRPEEAIPYAEQAAQAQPQNPNVLDTLGWAQARAGRLEKAARTLEEARRLGRGGDTHIPVALHLAHVRLQHERTDAARQLVEEVRALAQAGTPVDGPYTNLLSELEEQLRSAN